MNGISNVDIHRVSKWLFLEFETRISFSMALKIGNLLVVYYIKLFLDAVLIPYPVNEERRKRFMKFRFKGID
jgi:hypothetical protein